MDVNHCPLGAQNEVERKQQQQELERCFINYLKQTPDFKRRWWEKLSDEQKQYWRERSRKSA